jgi:sugar/nucleoside kinase (ribokinase family)
MPNREYDIYGLGNAIMDLQLNAADEDLAELGLTKGSVRLTDTAEQGNIIDFLHARKIHQASGGSAANTVITLTQLGGKAAFGCLLGDDVFGRSYRNEMQKIGVTLNADLSPGKATGTCVVLITPDAERTMNTHLGVSAEFGPEHVSEEKIKQSSWVYIEGYLLSSPAGQEAARKAAALAKKHGVRVALTFSDTFIVEEFGSILRELAQSADLVFANLSEAQKYTGEEGESEAFAKLCKAVPNAAMTAGDKGARIRYDGLSHQIAAIKTNAVDATGAGDTFAGAFLYGITHGMTGSKSGELACLLASKVVSQLGPRLLCDVKQLVERAGIV